ncbi:hypothetical protein RhiirA4_543834 [Rhizophagus irregularis]|uniref:Ion transport domain-containing protein n=1 Tax=Rhizophagus irregularis TaxID=588596 RepID=A0A2I1GKZ1_9GLOM|nr:hypothetical protein RhiirA4_543834 [Rhizophagus irregularis]
MTIISLNLAELCDYYHDYIIKYILRTSVMLSPYCNCIENSKNTSLHSHINIYIKESNKDNTIFKFISELYNGLIHVFQSYGMNFILIFKLAPVLYPSFVLLFFVIFGYAQAFYIILRSNGINDDNDPQNLATEYEFVNSDGIISNTTTIIQVPDSNTNLFNWFPTSLLAVYKLITGDSESLSSFTYREHPTMTFLLVSFTFFTVIYLLNLFIGLLNIAIDSYNREEEFLFRKAQIIMEIELFYLLPWQRNNKEWFPDWIYYNIPITNIRKLINAIDNEQTEFNYPPIISKKLRELVVLSDNNDNKLERKINQTKEELTKQNVELKQQIECIIKYIGIEQDNKKEKDSEEKQYSEEEQDSKEDKKKKQDNKLEKQIKQTKEGFRRELKEKMNKMEQKMEQKMDKIEQKIESIMESLSKIK